MHVILVVPFESVGDVWDAWVDECWGTKDGGGVEIVEHDWSEVELKDFDDEILLLSISDWDSKKVLFSWRQNFEVRKIVSAHIGISLKILIHLNVWTSLIIHENLVLIHFQARRISDRA